MLYSGLTDTWDPDVLQYVLMAPIQAKRKYHSPYHKAW